MRKILVIYLFSLYSVILSQAGSLDLTFNNSGVVTTDINGGAEKIYALELQSDGKIVVCGIANYSGHNAFTLARYNTDGTLDSSFDSDGIVTTDIITNETEETYGLAIQSDGKLIAVGYSTINNNYTFTAIRYNSDGAIDSTFDADGIVTTPISTSNTTNDKAQAVTIQDDGKIIVVGHVGETNKTDFGIVRYNTDGSLDTSFDSDGIVTFSILSTAWDTPYAVQIQSDDKILVAGSWEGNPEKGVIIRINSDGSLDTTFDTDGILTSGFDSSYIYGMDLQSDGKIVVSGYNESKKDFFIARVNSDGSFDTSFDGDGKVTTDFSDNKLNYAFSVKVQTDGKIIAGGYTRDVNDSNLSSFSIARYNSDGSLDTSFDGDGLVSHEITSNANNIINDIAIQPDGKIVAGGYTGTYSPFPDFALARYHGKNKIIIPIIGAEYFIDEDPGEGNGIPINASDGAFNSNIESVSFDLNTSSLSLGAHLVYIRFQDSTGTWSNPRAKRLTVSNPQTATIQKAEYFLNSDPGEGVGVALNAEDGAFDSNIDSVGFSINTGSISLGTHSIYLRFQDSDGIWGEPRSSNFTVSNPQTTTIQNAEYFINTDPGEGNGIAVSASDGAFDNKVDSVSFSINTSDISLGAHHIYLRFKDSDGIWGNPRSVMSTIGNPEFGQTAYIKGAEFFFGTDPGVGKGNSLTATDGSFNDTTEAISGTYVENFNLTHGIHYLNVRAKNSKGIWGNTSSNTLQVNDVTKPTVSVTSSESSPTSASSIPLSITFNEPVTGFDSSDVTVRNGAKSAVTGTDKSYAITINPVETGNVAVSIPADAANDLGSNGNEASSIFNIKFDNTKPLVATFSPADGAFGVNKNSNLVITFNENVFKDEGDVSIYKSDGALFEKINISSDQIAISDSIVTINPNGTFSISTDYYVKIDNNVFKDEAGNFYAGIYDTYTWNFTVISDTEYPATQFTSSLGVEVGTLEITDEGTITDLAVKVNVSGNTSNFLRYVSLSLISPNGTNVYLVGGDQIKSNGLGSNGGSSFTNTIFSDGGNNSIYSGSSPFIGSFKPEEELSTFDGEPLQGTWSLVLNNKSNDGGTIDWSILSNIDQSTPSQPITYGIEYKGNQISSGLGVNVGTLAITESKTITDIEANITLEGSKYELLRYISLTLISPSGTPVYFFGGDQLLNGGLGQYSGPDMYKTIFDDESNRHISDGFAPFVGQHKPFDALSKIDGEDIAGNWTLVVNNKSEDTCSVFWSLYIESDNSVPKDKPDLGTVYTGNQLESTSIGVVSDTIKITDSDTLSNIQVKATIKGGNREFLRYSSLSVQSPNGTAVTLFSGDQLASEGLGQYSGPDLYLTKFNDEAVYKIIDGKAPYVGPHKPIESLRNFNGETVTGDWLIYFNNKSSYTAVLDWKLYVNPPQTIPQVLITSSEGSSTTKKIIPITVSFTEEVTGFDTSDVVLTNGSIADFSGSGAKYTFNVISKLQGDVTINIAENVAQDLSGNGNIAAKQFSIYFDEIPTVSISSTSQSPTNITPIPITVTFSEKVSDFDSLDVTISNASLSGFSGSDKLYQFNLNPVAVGDVTVQIPENAGKDSTGNGNTASSLFSIRYTTIPSVTITSSLDSITNLSPIPIKITFSKDVTGFDASDIAINNGSLSQFSGTGAKYEFNLIPTNDGIVSVDVNANVATDSESNGNYAAKQFSIIYDKTSPQITVSTSVSTPTQLTLIPISLEFTEKIYGLDSSDILIDNGTLKDLTGEEKSYSFNVVPQGAGYVGIFIPAGVMNDVAGNGNEASEHFTVKYDDNIYLDSFDSLSTWTNTTNSSTSGDIWYIDANGYSGNGARSDVGGFGYGDKLSKEFEFTADVKVKLWVKKQSGYSIKAYFKSDGQELWSFGDTGDQTNTFVQKEAFVSKGKHTISIETDYAGSLWIDELEIETVTNPLVSISSFFVSPTNSSRIPISVSFTNTVTGFDQNDISAGNGNISNFSGSGKNYSFDVSPVSEGNVTIDIPKDVAQDENNEGNKEAIQFVIKYDVSAPKPILSWDLTSPTNKSDIPIFISFDEPVKNILSSDFSLMNCEVDSFSGKDSLYYLQVSPNTSGKIEVNLSESVLNDIAGNENEESNKLSIIYDGISPLAGMVNDGAEEDLDFQMSNTTITASWKDFKDNETGIKSYKWAIGKDHGDTTIQTWKMVGLNKNASNSGLALEDGRYFISVVAIDSAGNESNLAASDGVKVDTKAPEAPQKLNVNAGDMAMTLTWSSNLENDLNRYVIHRSEVSGFVPSKSDSIGEVEFRETKFVDNSVAWGKDYFYRVGAIDSTGYQSGYSAEASGTPLDLTEPNVTLNEPLQKTSFEVGTISTIKWSGFDNSGELKVDIDYQYDNHDWVSVTTGEDNDGIYDWFVPNTPSKDVSIRIIAKDGYGNTDTSSVSNIEIFFVYPSITDISPQPGIINWYDDGIKIRFSRDMDSTLLSLENIDFNSIQSSPPSLTYDQANYTLSLGGQSGFISDDTISFTFDASALKSTYGYELNGVGGSDLTINYTTALHADYDTSFTIDDIDLAYFVQGLESDNIEYELGPVTGAPPHFNTHLDGSYDIEDLMAFIMMWNWYVTSPRSSFNEYESKGKDLEIISSYDSIFIELPENVLTYQIQVKYPAGVLDFEIEKGDEDLKLSYNDSQTGIFTYLSKSFNDGTIIIPTKSENRGSNVLVSVRSIDRAGNVITQKTQGIFIEGIPTQFSLDQNYPNPFNPITQIEYAVPIESPISLVIYDIMGREVLQLVNEVQKPGYKTVIWKGLDNQGLRVSSGIYFYQLKSLDFVKTRKMVLLK